MSTKSFSSYIFAGLIVIMALATLGASYCPPPIRNATISTKRAVIKKYHFKDTAYDCNFCHPSAMKNGYKKECVESDACYTCHNRVDNAEWVHGPIGVGQCSVCHDPHGSKNANFLRRNGKRLCMFCHDEDRMQSHATAVSSNDCMGCHDPHGGTSTALLRS